MFFSLEEIKRITSPEYLHQSEQQDSTGALLDELVAKIEAAGLRYEYEERAAILEYDAGMNRHDAEFQAVIEIMNRIEYLNVNGRLRYNPNAVISALDKLAFKGGDNAID